MKDKLKKFNDLSLAKKVQVVLAAVLTLSLITAIPVYAWFSNQKRAAEMYKIECPNSLYINAAHREDQVRFDLGEINLLDIRHDYNGNWLNSSGEVVKDKSQAALIDKMLYAFSVSGSNCKTYTLQLAHTTNNMFTYKLYKAHQYFYDKETDANANPENGVIIKTEDIIPSTVDDSFIYKYNLHANSNNENPINPVNTDDVKNVPNGVTAVYYVKDAAEVNGSYLNDKNKDNLGDKSDVDDYESVYYDTNYIGNTNVDDNAVPLYWQALCTTAPDANKNFCDYYILEVTFANRTAAVKTKESDLVYFSVKRKS